MDVVKLKKIMLEKGITLSFLAHILGINQSTLYRKISKGGSTFTIREIQQMVKKIPLSKDEAIDIFLRI